MHFKLVDLDCMLCEFAHFLFNASLINVLCHCSYCFTLPSPPLPLPLPSRPLPCHHHPNSHRQQPGYWTSVQIPVFPSPQWDGQTTITIHQSIATWRTTFANLTADDTPAERVLVRQSCHEPHCRQEVCPESFNTGIDKSLQWIFEGRVVVVVCVLGILACSIAMWLCLKLHYCCLHHRQRNYLDSHALYRNLNSGTDAGPYSVSHWSHDSHMTMADLGHMMVT